MNFIHSIHHLSLPQSFKYILQQKWFSVCNCTFSLFGKAYVSGNCFNLIPMICFKTRSWQPLTILNPFPGFLFPLFPPICSTPCVLSVVHCFLQSPFPDCTWTTGMEWTWWWILRPKCVIWPIDHRAAVAVIFNHTNWRQKHTNFLFTSSQKTLKRSGLNYGSVNILDRLSLWNNCNGDRSTSNKLHKVFLFLMLPENSKAHQ